MASVLPVLSGADYSVCQTIADGGKRINFSGSWIWYVPGKCGCQIIKKAEEEVVCSLCDMECGPAGQPAFQCEAFACNAYSGLIHGACLYGLLQQVFLRIL